MEEWPELDAVDWSPDMVSVETNTALLNVKLTNVQKQMNKTVSNNIQPERNQLIVREDSCVKPCHQDFLLRSTYSS